MPARNRRRKSRRSRVESDPARFFESKSPSGTGGCRRRPKMDQIPTPAPGNGSLEWSSRRPFLCLGGRWVAERPVPLAYETTGNPID